MKQAPVLGIIGGNGWFGSALGRSILTSGLAAPDQLVVTNSRTGHHYQESPRCPVAKVIRLGSTPM